jgi:hypothetical protein
MNKKYLSTWPSLRSEGETWNTRSYSLPLWKKKSHSPDSTTSDSEHIVLKVPMPRCVAKSPCSGMYSPPHSTRISHAPTNSFTSKRRYPSRDTLPQRPLPSCLVTREPPSPSYLVAHNPPPPPPYEDPNAAPSPSPQKTARRSLRACCIYCYPVTEECLKYGGSIAREVHPRDSS